MSDQNAAERQALHEGVERLKALLELHGFRLARGGGGFSSGGPFAVARFIRGSLELGLIVRDNGQLGCPNYSTGSGFAGHGDLFAELGYGGQELLVRASAEPFDLAYVSRDGSKPFDALYQDLAVVVLPALDRSEEAFLTALDRAVARHQQRLSGHSA